MNGRLLYIICMYYVSINIYLRYLPYKKIYITIYKKKSTSDSLCGNHKSSYILFLLYNLCKRSGVLPFRWGKEKRKITLFHISESLSCVSYIQQHVKHPRIEIESTYYSNGISRAYFPIFFSNVNSGFFTCCTFTRVWSHFSKIGYNSIPLYIFFCHLHTFK